MLYAVRHETIYAYSEPVVTSHNEGHLLPRATERQTLQRLELRIEPTPNTVRWHKDYFGNDVVFFDLEQPHERLVIRAESRVEVEPRETLRPEASPAWEEVASRVRRERGAASLGAFEFVFDSAFVPTGEELAAYARPSFPSGRPLVAGLLDLGARIHREFHYDPEATTVATPVGEVLRARRGVCQDFAHVMIACLRSLGLPARYVSGYLPSRPKPTAGAAATVETSKKPVEDAAAGESPRVGAEASHAWVSAWCPTHGWVDVDPTNDVAPSDRHVVLAVGRDYDDVSPVKGVTLGGGAHSVSVRVEVRPPEEMDA